MRTLTLLLLVLVATTAFAADPISDVRWMPLTQNEQAALENKSLKIHELPLPFTPYDILRPRIPKRVGIWADRNVYLADDPVGQAVVYFIGENYAKPGAKLTIELFGGDQQKSGNRVWSQDLTPTQPKVAFLINLADLQPGWYHLQAKLTGVDNARAIPEAVFQKSAEKRTVAPFPADGVPLVVHEQNAMPDGSYPITTGIPLSRHLTNSVADFQLLEDGQPVPAQFSQRATWYPNGEVKWMGLDFIANYKGGKPKAYKLVMKKAAAPASKLKVTETDAAYTIDTGKIRFTVKKQAFNGVDQAWLLNDDGSQSDQVITGGTGAYLVDMRRWRYDTQSDEAAKVTLECSGPVRATVYATGWYVDKNSGEKLCQFRTRISAYAGMPIIEVTHRTIITFDTSTQRLADLGFDLKTAAATKYAIGLDGKAIQGDFPAKDSVYLHQDKWNHARVRNGETMIAEGTHSDGWAAAVQKSSVLSVALRNIWQLYPKELEVTKDLMSVHFWPKHGYDAFTDEDQLSRANIHKIYYAHTGEWMNLAFPQKYYDAFKKVGGGMLEQQDINPLTGTAQGASITNDFCLSLQKGQSTDNAAPQAALFQKDPNAIADPAWNAKSEAEGRFAPKDVAHFPTVEKVLDEGYRGANVTTPAILAEYGMWIWPDTHNNWSPKSKLPEWHRFWNFGHYQNVWEGWFTYLRGGEPWMYEWARDNTRHYMNTGTTSYDNPNEPMLCHIASGMWHVKSFTPWGSPRQGEMCGDDYAEVGAHFVNPDAFIINWLMTGDPIAHELMLTWGRAFDRAALPPERSREEAVVLGELLSYYANSWDPSAIINFRDLALEYFSRPCKENNFGFYHSQYLRRYWEQTRDPAFVDWITQAWNDFGHNGTNYHAAALLYSITKDKKYLNELVPDISLAWQAYYFNPEDPVDGYGPRLGDLGSQRFQQRAPYFLQALLDAGITSVPTDESKAPATKAVAQWKKSQAVGLGDSVYWLMPTGANQSVTLEITGVLYTNNGLLPEGVYPNYLRIEDANGKVIQETSILNGSLRPKLTVTLDAKQQPAPWKLYKGGWAAPTLIWTGAADGLTAAPTKEQAAAGK